jgi:hypothetical protein
MKVNYEQNGLLTSKITIAMNAGIVRAMLTIFKSEIHFYYIIHVFGRYLVRISNGTGNLDLNSLQFSTVSPHK